MTRGISRRARRGQNGAAVVVSGQLGREGDSRDFDCALDFSEGYAPVRIGEKWGLIDRSGKVVIEPRFEDAGIVSEGLLALKDGDHWGYFGSFSSLQRILD